MPNQLLQRWHSEWPTDTSYVQLLNDAVCRHTVALDTHCKRLEHHLQCRVGEVASKAGRLAFRQHQSYLDGEYLIRHLLWWKFGYYQPREKVEEMEEMISEDIAVWVESLQGVQETISLLKEELKTTHTCMSVLSTSKQSPANTGLPIHPVLSCQRKCKLRSLKKSSHKALWFVENLGLSVESVTLHNSTTRDPLVLSYTSHLPLPAHSTPNGTLHQILHLLERFGVHGEFYHEISMTHPSLPRSSTCIYTYTSLVHWPLLISYHRSYKVKQTRKQLTELVSIEHLPPPSHGVYHPFKDYCISLLMQEVQILLTRAT